MKPRQVIAMLSTLMGLCCFGNAQAFAAGDKLSAPARQCCASCRLVERAGGLSIQAMSVKLSEVSNGSLTFEESRQFVQAAGHSGNREHSTILKEIAAVHSLKKHTKVAFDALFSLWELGEPQSYFLENAKSFKSNPELAAYSIMILANSPTQEVTENIPNEQEVIGDNRVSGALSQYRYVYRILKEYRGLPDIAKKVSILEQCILTGWSPMGIIEEYEPTGNRKPLAVWAQAELLMLSKQEPAAVAQKTLGLRPYSDAKDWQSEHYRAYFMRFIGEEAKTKYEELRKASELNAPSGK